MGKTTIGTRLAQRLGYGFADLDAEIERHFGRPIGRLKAEAMTPYSFRKDYAAVVLKKITGDHEGSSLVITLPPSGLMAPLRALTRGRGSVVIVLKDTAENILKRVTFYDDDSRPLTVTLADDDRRECRRQIAGDIEYFGRSYRSADLVADIAGLDIQRSAAKIEGLLRGGEYGKGPGRAGRADQGGRRRR